MPKIRNLVQGPAPFKAVLNREFQALPLLFLAYNYALNQPPNTA